MYTWRQISPQARKEILAARKRDKHPWHSPPHWEGGGASRFLFTAACYEHRPVIGRDLERMSQFETELLTAAQEADAQVFAWVILPNHYHFLARVEHLRDAFPALGRLHGRTSFQWNGEDGERGRKVWYNVAETAMKSERHFWASVNYVHHNPVKHEYVEQWQDWPFSSAARYLEETGRDKAERIWKEYPISDYGKGWDD